MPAERSDSPGDLREDLARREIDQSAHEVEASAADTGRMQSLELRVRDVATDGRHAARAAAGMDKRVDERAIVVAVAGRLHDDIALEPEKIAQREQLFLRRVAWRVFALRCVGKRPLRSEDVAMRVHRTRRYREAGLRRSRIKRQVVCIHAIQSIYLRPAFASASRMP